MALNLIRTFERLQPLLSSPTNKHQPDTTADKKASLRTTAAPRGDKKRRQEIVSLINARRLVDYCKNHIDEAEQKFATFNTYLEDADALLRNVDQSAANLEQIINTRNDIEDVKQSIVKFLPKNQIHIEKEVEQADLHIPEGLFTDPADSKPIEFQTHRLKSLLENMQREQLMGSESPKVEIGDDYAASENEMKEQQDNVNHLAKDISGIAEKFKHRMNAVDELIGDEQKIIKDGDQVLDSNISKLKKADQELKAHHSTVSVNLFSTVNMIFIVLFVFFSMIFIIKVFPKRL
ncbi:vesicle transport protein USE1 [Acrasis kona]|uniref:Vesicle transport protein USE1 n=1 Tax=Acrasis kona TaxID=1008807 RepID=A0AAW2Z1C2_9EUKA